MARRPLDKINEHHELGMHFLHASRAWRRNKRENFSEAGSSGSFEYIGMMQKNQELSGDFDQKSILDVGGIEKRISQDDWTKLAIDRRQLYRRAKDATPEKIPKELARIIEQTLIPVYMDGTQRPPRKCRIITS